jgi:hypothetical protein
VRKKRNPDFVVTCEPVNGGNGPSGPFYVPMPFRPCERLLFRINKLLFSEKKIVNKLFRIQQVLNPGLLVLPTNTTA